MVTIRIPAPSSMLVANLLGVLGLAAVTVAVGGLAGVWWAVLTGGVLVTAVAMVAMANVAAAEQQPAARAATAPVAVAPVEEQRAA